MTSIRLSADLSVDAVEYASRANAILGIRDSGKTYTGTMIAEQLFNAGIPFFAFDPIGRWRFLRLPSKDGGPKARGFPIVVAGGAAPDLPLTPDDAPKLIRAAMASGVSVVIDLYSVKLSKADWRKIVKGCFEVILYENEGHGLRHVFLEEAGEFIPQKVFDTATYAAVEKTTRMGGNVGIGVTLINPRAEGVNKEVLELCENLLLHRQTGKNSLTSLEKWLKIANIKPPKDITDSLADLPTGKCWAWFKEISKPKLITVARKQSFDANRRDMARIKGTGTSAGRVDVSAFVARMKDALAGKPIPPATKPAKLKAAPAAKQSSIHVGIPEMKEAQVDEKEAHTLRAENKRLSDEVAILKSRLSKIDGRAVDTASAEAAGVPLDMDAIYAEVKRRAANDPGLLRVLAEKPGIEIAVERKTIQIDGSSLKGRIAKLIAYGFFDKGVTNSGTRSELKRTGPDANSGNIWKTLADLVRDGFLTLESGDQYTAVEGMKIRITED